MGTTLESKYAERLREFRERAETLRASPSPEVERERDVARCQEEEIEYMLDAMPFIREYSSTQIVEDTKQGAGGLSGFVAVTHKSKRNSVLQRYLLHVEKQVDPTTMAASMAHEDADAKRHPREAEYFCQTCDHAMEYHSRESMLVCPKCGTCRTFTEMTTNNLTYEQEINRDFVTYFAYKRLNHFCEWLNSLQAKVRSIFFCSIHACPAPLSSSSSPPSWPLRPGCSSSAFLPPGPSSRSGSGGHPRSKTTTCTARPRGASGRRSRGNAGARPGRRARSCRHLLQAPRPSPRQTTRTPRLFEQLQENTDIPESVLDAVKAEFKKARTTTRADIKPKTVREFLKKLKLNK